MNAAVLFAKSGRSGRPRRTGPGGSATSSARPGRSSFPGRCARRPAGPLRDWCPWERRRPRCIPPGSFPAHRPRRSPRAPPKAPATVETKGREEYMSTPLSLTAASLTRGAKPCQAGADQRRRAGTTTLSTLRRDLRVRQDEAVSGLPALVVEQLTKRFGDRVAVNAVSFTVAAGEVFGFLGRNGGFCLSRRRISPPFAASGPPASGGPMPLVPIRAAPQISGELLRAWAARSG
jgi:hypothetical protein